MGYIESCPDLFDYYDFQPLKFHLYDSNENNQSFQDIPFYNYKIIIFAFSLMSIQIPKFQDFMRKHPKFFNQFHPNVILIAGGAHVTANPLFFRQFPINFLIHGEGEIPFSQLLYALINNAPDHIDIKLLKGISQITPRYIEEKASDQLIDIGSFPPFSEKLRLFGPIEISRGCQFRCKFCQTGNQSKHMRHVPIDQVIRWIKRVSEIKFDKVWFLTPNAFAYQSPNGRTPNPSAIETLLSRIKNEIPAIKQIFFGTFPSEVRPESVTEEVLQSIVPYIANKKITIGAQTASNALLKKIQRGHTFEDVLNAINLLEKYNLIADLDFIFGLPGETQDDERLTITFFNEVLEGKYSNIRIHTHTFMPLPGTPYENEPVGKISPNIAKIVGKLASKGKAYGEYQNQAKIKQISNLNEKKHRKT